MFRFLLIFIFFTNLLHAQDSLNISLLYNYQDTSIIYNEVWGVVQGKKEYAIIGATDGTFIFDVTNPTKSKIVDYIAGKPGATHRDFHDYRGYLYMVNEGGDGSFQIIDLNQFPDFAPLVYDSQALFKNSHNIFIDSAKGILYTSEGGVYSLSDPKNPKYLGSTILANGHDLYVRNDTAFWNSPQLGIQIYDYSQNRTNPKRIGSISNYKDLKYNHSGWLNKSGNIYAFADEAQGTTVKICDVSDYSNIKILSEVNSGGDTNSVPHNLMIKDNVLFISYYSDGLYVYDIFDPEKPKLVGFYDTYPLPEKGFRGAWGIYAFLPSGNILVSDRTFGLHVFDVSKLPTSTAPINEKEVDFVVSPNPFQNSITISHTFADYEILQIEIRDQSGRLVKTWSKENASNPSFSLDIDLNAGIYFISINDGNKRITKRLIKL